MKIFILSTLFLIISLGVFAQVNSSYHYVKGYTRSDGTQVQGYYRTNPNSTNTDNYSTRPNVNPWTGKPGTVAPDNNTYPSTYYSTPSPSSTTPTTQSYPSNNYPNTSYNTYRNNTSTYTRIHEIQYHNKYTYDDRLAIEKLLFKLGYNPGVVDGIFTDSTIYAIQSLQIFLGVQSDGMFGEITFDKIIEIMENNH